MAPGMAPGMAPSPYQQEMFTESRSGLGIINTRPNEMQQNGTVPASVLERILRYGKTTTCKTINTPTGPIVECNKNIQ
jgi:hypothetical protein